MGLITENVQIKDLGTIITGGTPPTNKREFYGDVLPLIKPTDMNLGQRYIGATEESLSELGVERFKNKLVPINTPCVVTIGTIGKSCLTKETSLVNQAVNCVVVDFNKYDYMYVYYLMQLTIPKVKAKDSGTASGRENVSKSSFETIEVAPVKNINEQKKLGKVLSTYDNLIENNNRRIAILENMAQSLYQEWFVKFRFPGHQNTKFKESSLGLIPEGWEIRKFKDELLIQNGCAFKSKDYSDSGTLIIRTKDFALSKYINVKKSIFLPDELLERHNKYHIQEMDFLLIMVGASIGKYGIVFNKDLPALQNQNMWAIRPNTQTKLSRTYILLSMQDHIDRVMGFATGAARDFFRKEFFNNQDILLPSNNVLEYFETMAMPMMTEVGVLLGKNSNLKKQRDLLLPKLISGSIEL